MATSKTKSTSRPSSAKKLDSAKKSDPKQDTTKTAPAVPVKSGTRPKPPPPPKKKKRFTPNLPEGVFDPNDGVFPRGWEIGLRINHRERTYKVCSGNALLILTHHKAWAGMFAYDEFIGDIVTTRKPNWPEEMRPVNLEVGEWTEEDMDRLRLWLDRFYGIDMGVDALAAVVRVLARKKLRHFVRDRLLLYKWDGKPRIDDWLIRIAGADDTPYTRAVGTRFLIGAVARVLTREKKPGVDPGGPGCKHDCMPVFEGKTGLRKSSMLKSLYGAEFFGDTMFDLGNKDSYQVLKGKWAYEFGELSHFDKKSMEDIKGFISSSVDRYRPSYGRKAADFPRQCIFAGTTEDERWHRDDRGGRRFWPVRLHGVGPHKKIDIKQLEREREQLWAEAVVRFKLGAQWYLDTPELDKLAAEEIDKRRLIDPWEEDIAKLITKNTANVAAATDKKIVYDWRRSGVTTSDILDGLELYGAQRTAAAAMKVGAVMRLLGWYRLDHGTAAPVRYKYYPNDVKPLEEPLKLVVGAENKLNGEVPSNVHFTPSGPVTGIRRPIPLPPRPKTGEAGE